MSKPFQQRKRFTAFVASAFRYGFSDVSNAAATSGRCSFVSTRALLHSIIAHHASLSFGKIGFVKLARIDSRDWQRNCAPNRRIFTYVRPFRSDLVRLVMTATAYLAGPDAALPYAFADAATKV